MNPKVSLIIPVYKVEKYLPRCLESVAAQTYDNFETILVDDGSPDRCGEMCDAFAATHENVIVIHQENQGVSVARNRGMELASGEWIMFLDADDWIDENTLEVMSGKTTLGYDIVSCSFYFSFVDTEKRGLPDTIKERAFPVDEYREYLYAGCILNVSAWGHWFPEEMRCGPVMTFPFPKLYRTSLLRENHIAFKTGLTNGEDKCFNLEVISKANGVYMISDPFYHYRQRKSGSGGFQLDIMTERFRTMYAEIRGTVAKLGCGEKAEKSVCLDTSRILWGMLFAIAEKNGGEFWRNIRTAREFMRETEINSMFMKVEKKDLPNFKKIIITKMLQLGWITVPAIIIKAYAALSNNPNSFE